MAAPVCPYCGDPLVGKSASRDHVFMDALGATATVLACRQCNSTLGHTLEAALLKHDQLLNLARLAVGVGGKQGSSPFEWMLLLASSGFEALLVGLLEPVLTAV
ncbi:HNH endonuclease, partial [Kocuria sp. CNJ-770]|uniref:HNH endonuclease n=1 Tax=Kocuria sp. CNJ-770 TaxID=1904964 RepID=UPI001115344F